jgi:hypothetical protein
VVSNLGIMHGSQSSSERQAIGETPFRLLPSTLTNSQRTPLFGMRLIDAVAGKSRKSAKNHRCPVTYQDLARVPSAKGSWDVSVLGDAQRVAVRVFEPRHTGAPG